MPSFINDITCQPPRGMVLSTHKVAISVPVPPQLAAVYNEIELVDAQIRIGLTALKSPTLFGGPRPALYTAWFSLSNGLERIGKLAFKNHNLSVDDKKIGHDVRGIIEKCEEIRAKHQQQCCRLSNLPECPNDDIHKEIIEALTLFCKATTRYYNHEVIDGGSGTDPFAVWIEKVLNPIRKKHQSEYPQNPNDLASCMPERERLDNSYCCLYVHQIVRWMAHFIGTSKIHNFLESFIYEEDDAVLRRESWLMTPIIPQTTDKPDHSPA